MKKFIVLSAVMLLGSASYGVSAHHCDSGVCTSATIKGKAGWGTGQGDGVGTAWVADCYTDEAIEANGGVEPATGAEDGILMTRINGADKTVEACKDFTDGQYDS